MFEKEPARPPAGQGSSSSQARAGMVLPISAAPLPKAAGRRSPSVEFAVPGLLVCNHGVSTISGGMNSQLVGGDAAEQKQAHWVLCVHPEV